MTTTVHISVSGNEHVAVEKTDENGKVVEMHSIAPPSGGLTLGIHGNQRVIVRENPPVKALADSQGEIDFELPSKACDLGRPEGCESCQ